MRRAVVGTVAVAATVLCACAPAQPRPSVGPATVTVTGDPLEINSVPNCPWPLRATGRPTPGQVGLIGCYLRALSDRSLRELAPLARVISGIPVTLTKADLRHAADAEHGTTSARFRRDPDDSVDATVDLRFADGAHESLSLYAGNVAAPAAASWRINLGTYPPDPSAPAPATRRR